MAKKNRFITADTIITSHVNADFDAIAAMLAAQKLYPDSVIIFPGSQEKNLRDFFISATSYLFNMADPSSIDFSATRRLVVVDTRQKNRLPHVARLLEKTDLIIHIYDHHPPMKGDVKGQIEVIEMTGSTTAILCRIMQEKKIRPSPEEATIMAMGIYEDTGLFTYTSTTPQDFEQAGFLLSAGASLETVVQMVVKEIKSEQVAWLNELLNEMNMHKINGMDIHVSVISSPSYITDLATIVQKVVRMENLDIFFAVVLMGNKIHIIARNRLPEVDVGKILGHFGGGGHPYAASAKVDQQTLAQVEFRLIELLQKEIKTIQVAKNLMSSPAITISPRNSCKEAGSKMTRYNINTLLVVDPEQNIYQGYISRQIVEKALFHQLSHMPVEDYMNVETGFVGSDADVSQIETILIEGKNRILPVIDNGRIRGVITRSDLLNYLVQHNKALNRNETELGIRRNVKKRQIENILYQRLDTRTRELLENIGRIGQELAFNTYVVGGFVRDLLLSRPVEDVDIVVEGDGIAFARVYAQNEGCRVNTFKKFGTAVIIYPDNFKIDVASARLEYYQTPAALPIVEKSSIKRDLARRDFTINTLAISLNPDNFGTMIDYFGANRDLKDKTIRTIHNLSFVEDPTRIFRAIKFSNRFGFNIGKVTSNLIKNAVKIDCFKNLSGLRVLNELKQIFEEDNPIPAIKSLESYGLEKVIHPNLDIIPKTYQLLESVNKILSWHDLLYTNEPYPRWSVYFMALLNRCSYTVSKEICIRLNVPLKERDLFLSRRYTAEKKLSMIETSDGYTKQEIYWVLINFKTEYILYMMALTGNEKIRKDISNFYTRHRDIRPVIKGKDLLEIGLKPGPVFTRILNQVVNAKLDDRLKTRKEELDFAVQYARTHKLID
ncbi:MAG: CBS domain-containing protein [Desulfobacterales bacterium]|nr:CBS domain-containing protein [Desulfobacterales bacterium]